MMEKVENEFMQNCQRKNLSKGRIRMYEVVFDEAVKVGVNLKDLTPEEIDKYFFYLQEGDYKKWTSVTKWSCFKKICRSIDRTIDFSNWKMKVPQSEPEILNLEEVRAIVNNISDFRDKVFALLLYESGARLGEMMNLKKGDVSFDQYGARVRLNGKTGLRYVRVVYCADLLKSWMSVCPEGRLFRMCSRAIQKQISNAAKRAGITKRIYPHLFRHSRATHLAKHLNEAELRIFFGWSKDSGMPSVYVHLSGRDVDAKIVKVMHSEEGELNLIEG